MIPHRKLYRSVLDTLLNSAEPSIRWKVRAGVLNEDPRSKDMRALREDIRNSPRVKTLLAHRDKTGRFVSGRGVYDKWQGAHWILATLADLGYPEGDGTLVPVREQILDCWHLVERLLHWRWPDGGWNCDKEPSASKSTFIHTIHSLRGLHLYGSRFRNRKALAAAKDASEIFFRVVCTSASRTAR